MLRRTGGVAAGRPGVPARGMAAPKYRRSSDHKQHYVSSKVGGRAGARR